MYNTLFKAQIAFSGKNCFAMDMRCDIFGQIPHNLLFADDGVIAWSGRRVAAIPISDFLGPTLGTQIHFALEWEDAES